MRLKQIVEGGWETDVTQSTVIHPSVVKTALLVANQFVEDFNKYLVAKQMPEIRIGHPTGSSAYYDVDEEEKIYGDIDLQFVAPETPETEGKTQASFQGFWYRVEDDFINTVHPKYVHPESSAGHPILKVGKDQWVQIDMMVHPEKFETWGRFRVTPERGIKGLLNGLMFSEFGVLMDLSIQHSGVQIKVRDKQRLPFVPTRSNYELVTISANIETFVLDVFVHEAKEQGIENPEIAPLLKANPGSDISNVKIERLANAIKGFAESCELNEMFGKGHLKAYTSSEEFIAAFLGRIETRCMTDVAAKKRDKAVTPEAIARAGRDKRSILAGLVYVMKFFKSENVNEEFSLKKTLASLLIAGSIGLSALPRRDIQAKADPELTKIGRATLTNLPVALQKKIGNVNDIIFVRGIPKGGSQNAICQIGKGENVVYVNPKYVKQFLAGAGDQLSAHELTHYAQSRMSDKMQKSFPETDPDESKQYGKMGQEDAWKILQNLRKNGDRMWNHSREEQAMIVQQREAQVDLLRNLTDASQRKLAKQKISVYDEYINDYDS
jgi:hypothetical protein